MITGRRMVLNSQDLGIYDRLRLKFAAYLRRVYWYYYLLMTVFASSSIRANDRLLTDKQLCINALDFVSFVVAAHIRRWYAYQYEHHDDSVHLVMFTHAHHTHVYDFVWLVTID